MSRDSCLISSSSNLGSAHFDRERSLIHLLTAFLASGIFFMFIPGTLLGVWNLIEIGNQHNPSAAASPWIQAHGHAQVFGWIGSFILGIGFYSIPKLRKVCSENFIEGWFCLGLWSLGVAMRWFAVVSGYSWRILLPASALMELSAVLLFVWVTMAGNRLSKSEKKGIDAWAILVISGTLMWVLLMLSNLQMMIQLSTQNSPIVPVDIGRKFLFSAVWAWIIPIVWGLSSRWLPIFLGLTSPKAKLLKLAAVLNIVAVLLYDLSVHLVPELLILSSCCIFVGGLRVLNQDPKDPKIQGVHRSFPQFVRVAYIWLLASAVLFVSSAIFPSAVGTAGAARHAITVGFLSTMVFSIGPRVLPSFLGRKKIFSEALMFASLSLLSCGCLLRVCSQILAYDFSFALSWSILPCSAIIELFAMAIFAFNLLATFFQPPLLEQVLTAQKAEPSL